MSIIDAKTYTVETGDGEKIQIVDMTGVDLRKFVAKAYELSKPQGLGFLHYEEGGLSESEIDEIIEAGGTGWNNRLTDMNLDYVKGRSVKMNVFNREGSAYAIQEGIERYIFLTHGWYDHTDEQFVDLLEACL